MMLMNHSQHPQQERGKDESFLTSTTGGTTAAGAGVVLLEERGEESPTTSTRTGTTFVEEKADGTFSTTSTARGIVGSGTGAILATRGFSSTSLPLPYLEHRNLGEMETSHCQR
ncbi:hypothetical protein Adt_31783 [Abeliophyllum distichum]|uniref:Uncharacterized protein n=1 Tax=Abeliophyllum distichum TaxID=126358 RepID=A0ABD1RGI5_9LAMI